MTLVDNSRVLLVITLNVCIVQVQLAECFINDTPGGYIQLTQNDMYNSAVGKRAAVILLYESHCPDCVRDYGSQILPTFQQLGSYIDWNTYPYGNAKTTTDRSGQVTITCQHGEAECYGNKLHACAIELLQHDAQLYVPYIACMMPLRSDDAAADQCGQQQQVDAEDIKRCAKSHQGFQLLQYYGNLSKAFTYDSVPTIFVNGQNINTTPLKEAVCRALNNSPQECK